MAARNKLLVLNAGSSSLKFKLFEKGAGGGGLQALASGLCERIGDPEASTIKVGTWCSIKMMFRLSATASTGKSEPPRRDASSTTR